MGPVLAAFANGAMVSALLTAAVWLALRLAPRRRLNAATRYAFWWATLAATLALSVLYLRTPEDGRVAPIMVATPTILSAPGSVGLRPARGRLAVGPQATGQSPGAVWMPARVSFTAVSQPQWIAMGWLAVSLFLVGRLIVSWVLLDRRRARASGAPAALCAQAERWLARCRPARSGVRLASSMEIAIPIAVGPRCPSILIPSRLFKELDDVDLGQIVLHEAAHLARRDDYALLVERLIEALFALHPVVRWITRQIDLEREVACDDFVVEATGQPRSYASCLTRMVELCGGVRASLAGATAAGDRSHLARRVDRLLDKSRHTGTRLLKVRLGAMVAVLVAAAWTVGRTPGLVAFAMPQSVVPITVVPQSQPPVAPVVAAPAPAAAMVPSQPSTQPAVPAPRQTAAVAAAVEPAAPLPAAAESPQPPTPPSPQSPPQAGTGQILTPVEVTDPMNRFVTGLGPENFKLFEDGVEQQISLASTDDVPISVGIVVDVSGSMGAKMVAERAAVLAFLKTARPTDEFFLLPFNDEPILAVPFTHDPEAIQNSLSNTRTRGGTSLRDAVYLAINEMKHARNHRKAILIVSDGTDNTSSHSASEMAATLREADLQVYAINLGDRPEPRAFAGIVEASGVDSATNNLTNAPDRAAKIAAGLRNMYVLSYTSNNAVRDGKFRRVQVQVVAPRGLPPLRVRYRTGYYAQ